MAIGLVLKDSLIALKKETIEGVYVAPAAGTDFQQPNSDKFELVPSKEWNETGRITGNIGQSKPRGGIKKCEFQAGYELRGSGVIGQAPQWGLLLESLLGTAVQIMSASATITAGATSSVLPMSGADVSKFVVGMPVMIQKPNAWFLSVVASIQAGVSITISPAAPYTPATSVIVSQAMVYQPANVGHPSISASIYWGNKILQKGSGIKINSMSLSNYKTGKIPMLDFAGPGINYQADSAAVAGFTPSYDAGLSPIVLNAVVYQNGNAIVVDQFEIKVANTLSPLPSTADPNGIVSQRPSKRMVTGSFAPYKDDTLVSNFTNFDTEASFSLFIMAINPDPANAGQYLPSSFCIYLPQVVTKTLKVGNLGGVLQDAIAFEAHGGNDGTQPDIFAGFV